MKKLILPVLLLALFFTACKKDDEPTAGTLALSLNGLEDLGAGYAYEGWVIVDGAPVSTGTFTVNGAGELSETSFDLPSETLDAATAFVLSIEPVPDSDPAPSAVKYLSGDFSGNTASVNAGIVGDFSSSTGEFIIATPTTTSTSDDFSGVWFLNNTGSSPVAGLNLPELTAGWAYEGWAVIDGTPVSTGQFTDVAAADWAADFSGTDASGPPFPGEDFIMNAPAGLSFPTDLSGVTMVISVEPQPDNSAAPFALKPLVGSSPASGTVVGNVYGMDNQAATNFPTGTVSRN